MSIDPTTSSAFAVPAQSPYAVPVPSSRVVPVPRVHRMPSAAPSSAAPSSAAAAASVASASFASREFDPKVRSAAPFALNNEEGLEAMVNEIERYKMPSDFCGKLSWVVFRIWNAIKAVFSCFGCCGSVWQNARKVLADEIIFQITKYGKIHHGPQFELSSAALGHINDLADVALNAGLKGVEFSDWERSARPQYERDMSRQERAAYAAAENAHQQKVQKERIKLAVELGVPGVRAVCGLMTEIPNFLETFIDVVNNDPMLRNAPQFRDKNLPELRSYVAYVNRALAIINRNPHVLDQIGDAALNLGKAGHVVTTLVNDNDFFPLNKETSHIFARKLANEGDDVAKKIGALLPLIYRNFEAVLRFVAKNPEITQQVKDVIDNPNNGEALVTSLLQNPEFLPLLTALLGDAAQEPAVLEMLPLQREIRDMIPQVAPRVLPLFKTVFEMIGRNPEIWAQVEELKNGRGNPLAIIDIVMRDQAFRSLKDSVLALVQQYPQIGAMMGTLMGGGNPMAAMMANGGAAAAMPSSSHPAMAAAYASSAASASSANDEDAFAFVDAPIVTRSVAAQAQQSSVRKSGQ